MILRSKVALSHDVTRQVASAGAPQHLEDQLEPATVATRGNPDLQGLHGQ